MMSKIKVAGILYCQDYFFFFSRVAKQTGLIWFPISVNNLQGHGENDVVESEKRRDSDLKQLEKRVTKQLKIATKGNFSISAGKEHRDVFGS